MTSASDAILLVGEANPRSALKHHALYPWPSTSAGARFRDHLRLATTAYLMAFDRVNLFLKPPRSWSKCEARIEAEHILRLHVNHRVILLGRRVAEAFDCEDATLFRWHYLNIYGYYRRVLCVPHPSGRCRAWNDPRAGRQLRSAVLPLVNALALGDP